MFPELYQIFLVGGGTRLVYFVDDYSLGAVDAYDTQSAISFLRQHLDYGHWYDRQKWHLKHILQTQHAG
jgi:dynein heavy chain